MRVRLKEIWKVVVRNSKYEVSNLGKVRRAKDKVEEIPIPDKKGYPDVHGTRVHHMVLEAFHGPKPFPEAQCRHLNGIADDNRASNLRWGTGKENWEDRRLHGTDKPSEEALAKMSASQKKRWEDSDARQKMSESQQGRVFF